MTYKELKTLTSALLIGDRPFPSDFDQGVQLINMAFNIISNRAESLHLLTEDLNEDIVRTASGDFLTRRPELPTSEADELDIDQDLCFAASRYVASFVSKDKPAVHEAEAIKLIRLYNGKVSSLKESIVKNDKGGYNVG